LHLTPPKGGRRVQVPEQAVGSGVWGLGCAVRALGSGVRVLRCSELGARAPRAERAPRAPNAGPEA